MYTNGVPGLAFATGCTFAGRSHRVCGPRGDLIGDVTVGVGHAAGASAQVKGPIASTVGRRAGQPIFLVLAAAWSISQYARSAAIRPSAVAL